jgi:hypothetical protein
LSEGLEQHFGATTMGHVWRVRLLLSHARTKRMEGRLMMVFGEMSIRPVRNNSILLADQ